MATRHIPEIDKSIKEFGDYLHELDRKLDEARGLFAEWRAGKPVDARDLDDILNGELLEESP